MQPRKSPVLACLVLLGRAVGYTNDEDQEGVGGGADRMRTVRPELQTLTGEEYEKYAHLSEDERKSALAGTQMIEVGLQSNDISIILDRPVIFKYVDVDDLDYWAAAKQGDLKRLKEILEAGQPVDAMQNGATAMYWAQYYMQPEAMKMLLERGADPNKKEQVRSLAPAAPGHCQTPLTSSARARRWVGSIPCTPRPFTRRTASVAHDCCWPLGRGSTCIGCATLSNRRASVTLPESHHRPCPCLSAPARLAWACSSR